MEEQIESLREHYNIEVKGSEYHLCCKVCGRGWALPRGSQAVGALLRLLDHARSHQHTPVASRMCKRR